MNLPLRTPIKTFSAMKNLNNIQSAAGIFFSQKKNTQNMKNYYSKVVVPITDFSF
jgi:hypothetical protein